MAGISQQSHEGVPASPPRADRAPDPEPSWDAAVEEELSRVRINDAERVPCRNFEYPIVRWTEAEMKSHVPEVLLSDDPLRMTGTPVGLERPVSQVKKKVIPNPIPSERDLDLSFLAKEVVAKEDAKWADIRKQFQEFMDDGDEQTNAVQAAMDELNQEIHDAFERLHAPVPMSDDEGCSGGDPDGGGDGRGDAGAKQRTRSGGSTIAPHADADADAFPPPAVENDVEVLNLSDFSDEEDREMAAEEGFLDELRQEIEEQQVAMRAVEEDMRAKAAAVAAAEFEKRVAIPEKKLEEIRATIASPSVKAEYARIAEEIRQRDEEFTEKITLREEAVEVEVTRARDDFEREQAEAQRQQQLAAAEREREEAEERARAEARLTALARENRKRLLADRKRFRMLKEQGEILKMESADIETRHAVRVLAEKQARAEAIERAKRIARETQESLQREEERDAVADAERAARATLQSEVDTALAVMAPGLRELSDHVARCQRDAAEIDAQETRAREGIAAGAAEAFEVLATWIRDTLGGFRAQAARIEDAEKVGRGEVAREEIAAREEVGRLAESNQKKAQAADLEIALSKQRRETYARYSRETDDGARALADLLRGERPASTGAAAGRARLGGTGPGPGADPTTAARLAGLKAQAQLRQQWVGFFDGQCLTRLRKQRVPVDVAQHDLVPGFGGTHTSQHDAFNATYTSNAGGAVDVLSQSQASVGGAPGTPLHEAASGDGGAGGGAPAAAVEDIPPERLLDLSYIKRYHTPVERAAGVRYLMVSFEQLQAVRGPIAPYNYLTELVLPNNNIAVIDGAFPQTLQHLDLTDNQLTGGLAWLVGMPGLATLKLDSNRVHSLSGVEHCPKLKDLSVRHNCVSVITPLKTCPCLSRLDLFGNNLSSLDLPDVSSLTYLNVGRNALTDVANVFRSCPLLVEVHLYNNRLTALPSRIHSTLVQTLLVSDNQIQKITDLSSMPLLSVLDVSGNRVDDIHGVHGCLHLEVLDLAFNNLDVEAHIVDSCRNLVRLRRLNINDNPFAAAGAAAAGPSYPDLLRGRFARRLPSLHEFNSEAVQMEDDEHGVPVALRASVPAHGGAAVARACVLGDIDINMPLDECLALSRRGHSPHPHPFHDICYDEVCGAHIAERRALDARAARCIADAKSKGDAAGGVALKALTRVEDMALQQVGMHATTGTLHIQHIWRQDAGYRKKKQQSKEHVAAGKIARWVRGVWRGRRQGAAAVKIQALMRGAVVRHRLKHSKWVDPDEEDYGAVTVDFEPEVDTSEMQKFGEIFKVFNQAHTAMQHQAVPPQQRQTHPSSAVQPRPQEQQAAVEERGHPYPSHPQVPVISGLLNPSKPAGARSWQHQLQQQQQQHTTASSSGAKTPTPPTGASGYRAPASQAGAERRESDLGVGMGMAAVFGRPKPQVPASPAPSSASVTFATPPSASREVPASPKGRIGQYPHPETTAARGYMQRQQQPPQQHVGYAPQPSTSHPPGFAGGSSSSAAPGGYAQSQLQPSVSPAAAAAAPKPKQRKAGGAGGVKKKRMPTLPYAAYGMADPSAGGSSEASGPAGYNGEGGVQMTPRTQRARNGGMDTIEDRAWKERNGVIATAEDDEAAPLSSVSLAWSSGMQRRDKKFELIRKRRRAQERALGVEREHTLEGKVEEVNRIIHKRQQQQAPTPTHGPPRAPGASGGGMERDMEVQSMTSTLISAGAEGARKESLSKSPLPPLSRSLNSAEGAKLMRGLL